MSVPSNLVPTRISELPELDPLLASDTVVVLRTGTTYRAPVSSLLSASYVPLTRMVTAGTGLSGGGALSANITINLANTAVTAAVYGSATQVSQITVDAQGRLTLAANVTISVPISTGVSGLGTGVATFLATPSSANLIAAVTDETGTGALVFATSPTLVTPALGTPASGVATNLTGTAAGLTAGTVTTNANLTGPITSVGNATSVASQTGTGSTFVMTASPTITTPVLTGLPTGTGVASAATASTLAARDASANLSADNFITGYTTTATAAGTTTLTVDSTGTQFFTGVTTQTVTLPVTSTLVLGQTFRIVNNSTGVVTVNSSGGNAVVAMVALSEVTLTCILITGTTAASWDIQYTGKSAVTGTGDLVLATSPTLVTPALGTPASGALTNCTGTAAGLTAGTVTTNANLTGPVTSVGNATAVAGGALVWSTITANPNPAVVGRAYLCNTSGAAFTVTLPVAPAAGDRIDLIDAYGTFDTNALTLGRNALNIMGLAADMTINTESAWVRLVYSDATNGWRVI